VLISFKEKNTGAICIFLPCAEGSDLAQTLRDREEGRLVCYITAHN
jgi:hypothetical protein